MRILRAFIASLLKIVYLSFGTLGNYNLYILKFYSRFGVCNVGGLSATVHCSRFVDYYASLSNG